MDEQIKEKLTQIKAAQAKLVKAAAQSDGAAMRAADQEHKAALAEIRQLVKQKKGQA